MRKRPYRFAGGGQLVSSSLLRRHKQATIRRVLMQGLRPVLRLPYCLLASPQQDGYSKACRDCVDWLLRFSLSISCWVISPSIVQIQTYEIICLVPWHPSGYLVSCLWKCSHSGGLYCERRGGRSAASISNISRVKADQKAIESPIPVLTICLSLVSPNAYEVGSVFIFFYKRG
jgi:hypothetical protein